MFFFFANIPFSYLCTEHATYYTNTMNIIKLTTTFASYTTVTVFRNTNLILECIKQNN